MGEARHEPGDLITRLVPILVVRDLDAERAFYEALGLRVTYEGPEYPDFIGLGNEAVEFGLERPKSPSDTPAADGGPAREADGEPAREADGGPAREADGEPAREADGEPARERVLTWQLGVSNVDEAVARCEAAGLAFTIEVHEPRPDWRYRTLKLRSPTGFDVVLEGPSEPV
jgi:catechol 2,3-dioxygenase-like lactoylglutathione lyase family enzyme